MRTAGLRIDQAPPLDVPLRYLLTAPLFVVAAGLLLAWGGPALLATPWHPGTIALAHLLTLGVLTMAMLGALYQLLPVVLGAEVPGARWSRWLHPVFAAGVVLLAAGLYSGVPWLVPGALVLLAAALLPLLGQHAACLATPAGHGATVQLLRIAVLAFAGTVALGLVFGAGHGLDWWPFPRRAALPVHVFWSLGGWVGALIAGVGIAVLPMFYIAPQVPAGMARTVMAALGVMLVAAPLAAPAASPTWLVAPLGAGAVALGAFTVAVVGMLRARRRKVADVSLRYWQGGLAAAWVALALAAAAVVSPDPRWLLAFGAVYLVGFGLSVLSGMLYRIVPFLVWMHRYSALAGAARIPMMSDLLPRRDAQRQQVLHAAAALLLTAAALVPAAPLVRVAGLVLALSGAYLWRNLLHAVRFRPGGTEPAGEATAAATAAASAGAAHAAGGPEGRSAAGTGAPPGALAT